MKQTLSMICLALMLPFASIAEQSTIANPTALSVPSITRDEANIVFADKFPEVLAVDVSHGKNNNWLFSVTLSSEYDTPKRYADAWRVLDKQDNELGIRILGHDHANEQPFTRSKRIRLPADINTVFVEGRDQDNGWSGQRFEVQLPIK